jgi:hypothetical protein
MIDLAITTSTKGFSWTQDANNVILVIKVDGTIMYHDKPFDTLSVDELKECVLDLINLLRRK